MILKMSRMAIHPIPTFLQRGDEGVSYKGVSTFWAYLILYVYRLGIISTCSPFVTTVNNHEDNTGKH